MKQLAPFRNRPSFIALLVFNSSSPVTETLRDALRRADDRPVSGVVPEVVVDGLQAVDIDGDVA